MEMSDHRDLSEELKNLVIVVGHFVKPYFTTQYSVKEHSIEMRIDHVAYRVVRPNHALAHGLRQSVLAVKIVQLLIVEKPLHPMSQWFREQLEAPNNDFLFKVAMVAAFQRTGRQSEIGHNMDPCLYKKYIQSDSKNFRREAWKYQDNFTSEEEVSFYADALNWPLKEHRNYLEILLSVSHKADLRRILSFDGTRIRKMILEELHGYPPSVTDEIWSISGHHLEATGDRDLVVKRTYQPTFFLLANDPGTIVDRLWK